MVVTAVDGSPEVVLHNRTGMVVPPGDSGALKEAMEIFINNRELAVQMGLAGRKHIEENFDICKQVDETQELYCKLASNETK